MEVKEILDAILEDKLVSVRKLAQLLGMSDLIFNSFTKLLISCFRDAICLSLCLISDKSFLPKRSVKIVKQYVCKNVLRY